jgi:glycosyltransferase involved in cell wall biosynthesis
MANLVLAPHRDPARDGRIDPGDRPRANGGGAVSPGVSPLWRATSAGAPAGSGGMLRTHRQATLVSFRLGGPDGVSVEAMKWTKALRALGFAVRTAAGGGIADVIVPGLDIDAESPPDPRVLARAVGGSDLVVVENVCSLPLNPAAGEALADALRGTRTILHHHDLPWQRSHIGPRPGWPPDDPAWVHVTINELSRQELAERGIHASTVYNSFDTDVHRGRRGHARQVLGIGPGERLLLQPTRAIPRKNIPASVRLAEAIGATYWLTGPAEDGYAPELQRILDGARCRVIRGLPADLDLPDAYAACDAVSFPSTWEGFGNPLIEAAVHRRPLAVGHYPVISEVARFGFRWFPAGDPEELSAWLDKPDEEVLDVNETLARRHFSIASLSRRMAAVMSSAGWRDLLEEGPAARVASGVGSAAQPAR